MRKQVLSPISLVLTIGAVLAVVGLVVHFYSDHALNATQTFFVVAGSIGVGGAWWLVARMVLEQRRDAKAAAGTGPQG